MQEFPAARPDLVLEELGAEVVVYDPRAQVVHVLNGSAGAVLLMCDGETGVDQFADRIATLAGASLASAEILAILEQFAAKKLLVE